MRKISGRGLVAALALWLASGAVCQAQTVSPPTDTGHVGRGKQIFKAKAHCDSCHGWAGTGDGDPHAAGDAANLRKSTLTREQIIEVIACGRPGSAMPHFDAYAYGDDPCYGMSQAELGKDMPRNPPRPLQRHEIEAIADYLQAKIIGKGKPTKAECTAYYGEAELCDEYP